ncbi:Protein kinase superfamily protein [Prunus dulcis]|uniref:Protein kinase superfamily protein n=1 Tax=Prunus dulcis TaxID=3755 RepID=A0A4Y1RK68_PRUDU|nr:Protein kinase superfamily protein [Prunus dulcis]
MNFRTATDNPEKFHGVITMVALGQHCCGCLLQHVSRRGGLRLLREQLNRWSSGSQKTGGQNTMTACREICQEVSEEVPDLEHLRISADYGFEPNALDPMQQQTKRTLRELTKLPLTKQLLLFPFLPSSFVERVLFAETEPLFSVRFQPAGWGAAMEEQCSLLHMRWRPSIFVWEVSCKSSRTFGIGRFHFFYILRLRLPSFLLANICIVCLQVLGFYLYYVVGVWTS